MTEEMAVVKDEPESGTVQKAVTASFVLVMACVGFANVVIGFVHLGGCGNALLLPLLLAINGVLWLLPLLVVAIVNCTSRQQEDMSVVFCFLEKLLIFSVVFLVASTIYVLVTATQVKTLDFLCSRTWLPPYMLCVVIADWLCCIVVFRLFCRHQLPPEKPPTEFRHLKNLPPLVFPWNRHRVLRTY